MSKPKIEIVDITGKKSVNCINCNFQIDIPLREISMKKIRHMEETKAFAEWHKKNVGTTAVSNVRLVICPNCGQPMVCTDEFSIHVGDEKKE